MDTHTPIDAVILWVDGKDPIHQQKMIPFLNDEKVITSNEFRTRFDQVEEIKYAVDSIIKFATFIKTIYIVTDKQTPNFLKDKIENDKYSNVKIVDHTVIFNEDEAYLPTFNCRPIETKLYKIPNLSEKFIYFNDDMILIKNVKSSDFFIDNKPVIRGEWLNFDENIFYKKVNNKRKKKRAGHKIAQQKAAKIVKFNKYYKFHHTPYPLRKSTFKNFFEFNKSIEAENIKYRFRHYNQFTPQGLANHLEIKNGTCVLKKEYQLCYIQSYKKPLLWYKFKLFLAHRNQNKLFLCLQSLDQCPPNKLKYILNWLTHKIEN